MAKEKSNINKEGKLFNKTTKIDRKPKPGDFVEISLVKKKYEGILLEPPKDEQGVLLFKLDSGYNIGFKKKDILGVRVLKKKEELKNDNETKKEKKENLKEIYNNFSKPNIAIVITGGTISSRYNSKTGAASPLTTPESLFETYPEIFEKVNISKIEVPFMKSSEDMEYKDWKKIAKIIQQMLNDSDIKGVIVTHGTDFLHYTSSVLSLFLKDLNKPVVLTYSQRSSDRASSDANLNLKCSALAAISDIAEVMLVGHATSNDDYCYAMPGTKVRKMHTSKRDAFKVINGKPIARVFPDRIDVLRTYNVRNKKKVEVDTKFESKIGLIKVYPGQSPDILDYYSERNYKGIILELSGLGHTPVEGKGIKWIKKLNEIQKKGMIVCATPQTIYGRLNPLVYSNGRKILKTGVIYLEDMLSETAFIKLGWVLGHKDWSKDKETIKEKMLENIAGEINTRLEK